AAGRSPRLCREDEAICERLDSAGISDFDQVLDLIAHLGTGGEMVNSKVSNSILRPSRTPIRRDEVGVPCLHTYSPRARIEITDEVGILGVGLERHAYFRSKECIARVGLVVLPPTEAEDRWKSLAFELARIVTGGSTARREWC